MVCWWTGAPENDGADTGVAAAEEEQLQDSTTKSCSKLHATRVKKQRRSLKIILYESAGEDVLFHQSLLSELGPQSTLDQCKCNMVRYKWENWWYQQGKGRALVTPLEVVSWACP